MAPSPELGQPKAPDKLDIAKDNSDTINTASGGTQEGIKSALTTITPPDKENLGNWDDGELKKLLDEAITYKRPKDREHKSETFKELLHNAELEDQRADCYINNRVSGRSSRNHGGSLQDLVEAVHNEHLLDSDFAIGGQARRHHSRQKKYSSVSSRQREGGSLPSNVNCNLCPYEENFLNEFNKRKIKTDKSIIHSSASVSRPENNCIWIGDDTHTVMEIDSEETRHLLAHDSLAQGLSEPLSGDEGTELNPMKKLPRVAMNFTTHQIVNLDVSIGESSRSTHSIDKTVQFNSLKANNKPIDAANNAVQLNNYVSVNSCIDNSVATITLGNGQNGKYANMPQNVQIQIDENGNSMQSFNSSLPSSSVLNKNKPNKYKGNKADRNTKTLIAKEIKGNRGNDNIESLLAFIENKETTRKNGVFSTNVNNNNKQHLLGNEKNKKNKNGRKENTASNKLKKSNSLEELKSSSKLEDEIAQSASENAVTLRHKYQQATKKTSVDLKENHKQQQQQKRGERRSWGTEELTYLGETNSITKESDAKKSAPLKDHTKTLHNSSHNKKKEEQSLSIISIESISTSSETAEFHVVTKKKKARKRHILEEARQKQMSHGRVAGGTDHSSYGNRGKYHPSHNYTNDREVYLAPYNAVDNRRKSTSSVPPSEKSDSSDLDSVHSLPIESTIRLSNNNSQPSQSVTSSSGGSTSLASYADIARTSNSEKGLTANAPLDKWPVVSARSPESVDISNPTSSTSLAKDNISSQSVPNDTSSCNSSSSSSTIIKQITYSQSLSEDKPQNQPTQPSQANHFDDNNKWPVAPNAPLTYVTTATATRVTEVVKTAANFDTTKNPLQKSKSVDNDNYVNMNIEHYPALEKTVKPQKQYQSLPVVESNNKHSTMLSSTKQLKSNIATSNPNIAIVSNTISTAANSVAIAATGLPKPVDNVSTPPMKKSKSANIVVPKTVHQSQSTKKENFNVENEIPDQNKLLNYNQTQSNVVVSNEGAITSTKKPMKRDKHQYGSSGGGGGSNRPPVLILNDNSSKYGDNVSSLLFGDFNDDVLRLLEQGSDRQYLPTSQYPNSVTLSSQPQSNTDVISNDTQITSQQSDLGYSPLLSHSVLLNESTIDVENNVVITTDNNIASELASNQSIQNSNISTTTTSSSCSSANKTIAVPNYEPIIDTSSSNNNSINSDNNSHTDENFNQSATVNATTVVAIAVANLSNATVTQNCKDISTFEKELPVHFQAPENLPNAASYNHDKIVNFLGSAWEDVMRGSAQFYNGQ